MAYNQPISSRLVLVSRVAQAPVNNTLGTVSFAQVDIGSQYLSNGSPPTQFNVPYAGNYAIQFDSWCCGTGSGEIIVTSTRSAVTQYAQQKFVVTSCANPSTFFYIPNAQAGDIVTMQANMNTTGTIVTSITNSAQAIAQGQCAITFYPAN